MKFWTYFLLILNLVETAIVQASPSQWTVFAIVNGDNFTEMTDEDTLETEEMAPKVFSELQKEALRASKINTIILYDPYRSVRLGPLSFHEPSILEFVSNGKIIDRVELGETNMADPLTIEHAITWGLERSETSRYFLYFWTREIPPLDRVAKFFPDFFDYSHPDSTYSTEKLRQGLIRAGFDGTQRRFEAIVMSSCWSASLQNIFLLGGLTNFYLGLGFRILYDGGLSRNFFQDLEHKETESVLQKIREDALASFQAPRKDSVASELGIPKRNPRPVIVTTKKLAIFRQNWTRFVELASGYYDWRWSDIIKNSRVTSQGSKLEIIPDWIDLDTFIKTWKRFLTSEIQFAKDPVARQALDLISEVDYFSGITFYYPDKRELDKKTLIDLTLPTP